MTNKNVKRKLIQQLMYIMQDLKLFFIEQKCYRTYILRLNKDWNMNFVDDNKILAVEK